MLLCVTIIVKAMQEPILAQLFSVHVACHKDCQPPVQLFLTDLLIQNILKFKLCKTICADCGCADCGCCTRAGYYMAAVICSLTD